MKKSASNIRISQDQYQQVLDAYGVGAILLHHEFKGALLTDGKHTCEMSRVLIETNKGLFLLVHAPDSVLHPIWWERDTDAFLHLVSRAVGLTYAVALATQADDQFVVHRFDERFTLFQL